MKKQKVPSVVRTKTTTTTNKSRQRRRIRRQRQGPVPMAQQETVVSKCTRDYIRAVANPFGLFKSLPCIPDMTILPSNKIMCKVRGVMSTGTAGIGWVVFNPFTALLNDAALSGTNIDRPVLYTGIPFAGSTYAWAVAGGVITTVGVSSANSNSPYNGGPTSGWSWRVVAAGLKVQYIGSNFRNQGRVLLYRTRDGSNVTQGSTAPDLLMSNYTVSLPVSRRSEYIFWTPSLPQHSTYYGRTQWVMSVNGGNSNFCMMIYVDGGDATTPQSWEFEATTFYEIVGVGLPLTPSHSDPVGYGSALSALPIQAPTSTPEAEASSFLMKTAQAIKENISSVVVNNVVPAIANYAANRISNYASGSSSHGTLVTISEPFDD